MVKKMNKIQISILLIGGLFGMVLLAEAKLEQTATKQIVVYNPELQTYHLRDSGRFSAQTLEQKFQTIQSINMIETNLGAVTK